MTRRRSPWGLRARFLAALMVIAIVPLGIVGLGGALLTRQAIADQSARELTGLARGLSAELELYLTGLLSESQAIAGLPEITSWDPARQEAILRHVYQALPRFTRLSVFDPTGRLVASSAPIRLDAVPQRRSFQSAAVRGEQAWEIGPSLTIGRTALLIDTPIRDRAGALIGILSTVVDLENLSAVVQRVPVGFGGLTFVIDAHGQAILHPDAAAREERRDYGRLGIPSRGRPAGPGMVRYETDSEPRIAGYAPVPIAGWTVIVEQPESVVLAPAEGAWRLALAGLGLSAALSVLAALVLAQTLTRPLRELALAVRAFGADGAREPSARLVPHPDGSEVGRLAEAFATMQAAVATREAALRESTESLRALVQASPLAIIVLDPAGQVRVWNPAATRMFGWTEAEVIGRSYQLVPPDLEAEARDLIARQRRGEALTEYETRRLRRDGTAIEVSLSAAPLFDGAGRVTATMALIADISDRKRAAEAQQFLVEAGTLLSSSLDYETTIQTLARLTVPFLADRTVIDLVDEQGISRVAVACADPARQAIARELFRFPPDRVTGFGAPKVLRTGEPEFLPVVPEEILRQTARSPEHLELILKLGNRSHIVVPMTARGRMIGALTLVMAESNRVYTRADLALAENLAHRVALAVDNARLYREAQEAIRLRDEFLSVAAHELKTPLTSLHGSVQLLRRRLERQGSLDPDRTRFSLQIVDQQTRKLGRLVTQLLDLSRLEAAKLTLDRSPADLTELVRSVVEAARSQTTRHTIALNAPPALPAWVDPLRIEQVLINLLDNAIKFSPKGGPIEVSLAPDTNDTARIGVRDHGLGIPEDKRAEIFNRFYQAHEGRHVTGMGLGLYVSRQIVQLHGGEILAEFPPDGGTRFTVTLPIGRPAAETVA